MKKRQILIVVCVMILSHTSLYTQNVTNSTIDTDLTKTSTETTATDEQDIGSAFLQEFYEEDGQEAADEDVTTVSPFWSAVKIILFTGVFGVIAYFLVKFIVTKSGIPATEDNELVEVILTKPVGLGNYIMIAKIGPSYYLLGMSSEGINKVDIIEDKETVDYLEVHKEDMKPKPNKFFDFMSNLPQFKKNEKINYMKNQKDKLKKF